MKYKHWKVRVKQSPNQKQNNVDQIYRMVNSSSNTVLNHYEAIERIGDDNLDGTREIETSDTRNFQWHKKQEIKKSKYDRISYRLPVQLFSWVMFSIFWYCLQRRYLLKFIINILLMPFSNSFFVKTISKVCVSDVAISYILCTESFLSCNFVLLGKALNSSCNNSIFLKCLTLQKNKWVAFTLIKVFNPLNFWTLAMTDIPLCLPLTPTLFNNFEYLAFFRLSATSSKIRSIRCMFLNLCFLLFLLFCVVFHWPFLTLLEWTLQKKWFFIRTNFRFSFLYFLTGNYILSTLIDGDHF